MRSFRYGLLLMFVVSGTGCHLFGPKPKEVKLTHTDQEFTVAPTGYEKPADLPREENNILRKTGPQIPAGLPGPVQPGAIGPASMTPGRPSR